MSDLPRIVLCVDDDADDRELVCDTITEIDPSLKIVHAENGIEAIEYLSKAKGAFDLPCLVILDINMPKMDGKQTLAKIKKDEQLNKLPVVVLSTSCNTMDKLFCDRFGVEFITKPSDLVSIRHVVRRIMQYCADA